MLNWPFTVRPILQPVPMLRPISAFTTNPNTKETDLEPTVLHTVTLSNGCVRHVQATEPLDAINIVTKELQKELDELHH